MGCQCYNIMLLCLTGSCCSPTSQFPLVLYSSSIYSVSLLLSSTNSLHLHHPSLSLSLQSSLFHFLPPPHWALFYRSPSRHGTQFATLVIFLFFLGVLGKKLWWIIVWPCALLSKSLYQGSPFQAEPLRKCYSLVCKQVVTLQVCLVLLQINLELFPKSKFGA